MKQTQPVYTLVQHSAYTAKRDRTFRAAVELQSLRSARDAETVRRAGGLIFDSYDAARDREEAENYPISVEKMDSLVPQARGTFVERRGIGHIYIPAEPLPPQLFGDAHHKALAAILASVYRDDGLPDGDVILTALMDRLRADNPNFDEAAFTRDIGIGV